MMNVIGIWGDSIVYGGYDRECGGWAARLKRSYDVAGHRGPSVYNIGIWGDKVVDALKRFGAEFDARKPETVILAFGTNDSAHASYPTGTPIKDFERYYDELVKDAISKSKRLILVGPTNVIDGHPAALGYRNDLIRPYFESIRMIAEANSTPFVDLFGCMAEEDLAIDGVHPNELGHEKILRKVRGIL